jgi:hypothetical protein
MSENNQTNGNCPETLLTGSCPIEGRLQESLDHHRDEVRKDLRRTRKTIRTFGGQLSGLAVTTATMAAEQARGAGRRSSIVPAAITAFSVVVAAWIGARCVAADNTPPAQAAPFAK